MAKINFLCPNCRGGGTPIQDQVKKTLFYSFPYWSLLDSWIFYRVKNMTVILLIFAYQKKMSLPHVTWVWGYILILSWCLKVAVAGCSTPRDIWGDIAIFLQIVYLSQATLLQIFTFFCVTNGDKKRRKSCNINIDWKKTCFVNNQRNRGVGGLTVKCQEGDVRNLDLTHTSYLWLFLPKFSFPHNSKIISNWTF